MRMVVIPRFKGCNMQANERNRGLATIPFVLPVYTMNFKSKGRYI